MEAGRSSPALFSWARIGASASRLAWVSDFDCWMTSVPTAPRRLRAESMSTNCRRWSASTFRPPGMASRAAAMSFFCAASLEESRSMLSIARTISLFCFSRPPTKVSSWLMRSLMSPSLPSSALLSSVSMTFSWATPPPLRSSDMALSTSSTSGLRPVRARGMLSPSPSWPSGSADRGGDSWTYFSPSSEVCLSSAMALSGSFTLLGRRRVTRAVQPFSSMASTAPTVTWSTLTDDWGTRSSTSANSAVTR